jgi:hypothetical protein
LSPEIVDVIVYGGNMADQPVRHFISGLPLNWHEQASPLRQR